MPTGIYLNNNKLSLAGEAMAAEYLTGQNYRILVQRYRNKMGEIDLVALKDHCIAFVEVKTRRHDDFGDPLEAITPAKLHCIYRASMAFLADWPGLPPNLEVEFLGIGVKYDENQPQLDIISLFPD